MRKNNVGIINAGYRRVHPLAEDDVDNLEPMTRRRMTDRVWSVNRGHYVQKTEENKRMTKTLIEVTLNLPTLFEGLNEHGAERFSDKI